MMNNYYLSNEIGRLMVVEENDRFYVAWVAEGRREFVGYHRFPGSVIEELPPRPGTYHWEMWVSYRAISPMCHARHAHYGCTFITREEAELAVRVANVALLSQLNWQQCATVAGWKPPEGV